MALLPLAAAPPLLPASRRLVPALLRLPSPRLPKPAAAAPAGRRIEGASEEMNAIASQDLDFAPARRRVRDAFSDAQQRLDHFLFKMAPTGIQMVERYEKNMRGTEVFWKSWLPRYGARVKGAVFFCHGYGDTCTFFFEGIAKRLADAGYAVYAMDYPGFGLTEGLHGYIPNFDSMVDQVIEQYTSIRGLTFVETPCGSYVAIPEPSSSALDKGKGPAAE